MQHAGRLVTEAFVKLARAGNPTGLSVYQPRPSDVIIATYPKAGTTLLQHMVYQITVATGGAPPFDPDGTAFSDINDVAPWVDYGPEFGRLECPTNPRIFKSHSEAPRFDVSQATYIYCIRNPEKYPGSWLDFIFDSLVEEKVTDPELQECVFHQFVRRSILACPKKNSEGRTRFGTWFAHVKSWTDQPQKNVLVLFYEDIVADLKSTALRIARFMGRTLSEKDLDVVVQRCERKSMAGDPKFMCRAEGDHFKIRNAWKAKNVDSRGYRTMELNEEEKQGLAEIMQLTFGVRSYEEFVCQIRNTRQD